MQAFASGFLSDGRSGSAAFRWPSLSALIRRDARTGSDQRISRLLRRRPAAQRLQYGLELFCGTRLRDESRRARAARSRRALVLDPGHEQNACARLALPKELGRTETVDLGHIDVHQDDVGVLPDGQ